MLHATQIIKRPLVTEKSAWEGTARNRYSFQVDMRSNKHQIKTAIGQIYDVRVVGVLTQIRKGYNYRTRHGTARSGDWKKAVVQVHADDKIEIF